MTTAEQGGEPGQNDKPGNGEQSDHKQSADRSSEDQPAQRSAVVSQQVGTDPDAVRAYWTPWRRFKARPPEFHRDIRQDAGRESDRRPDPDAEDERETGA